MNHKEKYDLKRKNFKKQSLKHFAFLVDTYKYDKPVFNEYIQPNGTVISDTLEYQNPELSKTVQIKNSYHPVDYGFEFNLWDSVTDLSHSNKEMLEFQLKEHQDTEQNYIEKIAESVKEKHQIKLTNI